MTHEGPRLHRLRVFNLREGHNDGNEWWIFTAEGEPCESWKKEQIAKHYLHAANEFYAEYGVAPRRLYRCLPGIGFIPAG